MEAHIASQQYLCESVSANIKSLLEATLTQGTRLPPQEQREFVFKARQGTLGKLFSTYEKELKERFAAEELQKNPQTLWSCPNCGHANTDKWKLCDKCGHESQAAKELRARHDFHIQQLQQPATPPMDTSQEERRSGATSSRSDDTINQRLAPQVAKPLTIMVDVAGSQIEVANMELNDKTLEDVINHRVDAFLANYGLPNEMAQDLKPSVTMAVTEELNRAKAEAVVAAEDEDLLAAREAAEKEQANAIRAYKGQTCSRYLCGRTTGAPYSMFCSPICARIQPKYETAIATLIEEIDKALEV